MENDMENNSRKDRKYRPALVFYHANARGTGCALKMEMNPATENKEGSIWVSGSNQKSIEEMRTKTKVYPRFDWQNSVSVKLGFDDLCSILQVLRGEMESINGDRGLYHVAYGKTTRIVFSHMTTLDGGFRFSVYRYGQTESDEAQMNFIFTPSEAVGLESVISGAMVYISFGVPSAYDVRNGGEQ